MTKRLSLSASSLYAMIATLILSSCGQPTEPNKASTATGAVSGSIETLAGEKLCLRFTLVDRKSGIDGYTYIRRGGAYFKDRNGLPLNEIEAFQENGDENCAKERGRYRTSKYVAMPLSTSFAVTENNHERNEIYGILTVTYGCYSKCGETANRQ